MRAKKLTGSYQHICELLSNAGAIQFLRPIEPEKLAEVRDNIFKDLHRIPLIGTPDQKAKICESWSTTTAYTQGDESGLSLLIYLSVSDPSLGDLVWNSDQTKVFTKHLIRSGYWTDNNTVGAMSLFCRQDKLDEWMFCTVTNASASLDDRLVTIYFSELLADRFELLKKIKVEEIEFYKDVKNSLQSAEIFGMINNAIISDGIVNLQESLHIEEMAETYSSSYPINCKFEEYSSLRDTISLKKHKIMDNILNMISKSFALKRDGKDQDGIIMSNLGYALFEKCESFVSLTSSQFTHADWSALQSECQSIIGDARKQLKEFQLPIDFFKLELLYIELYCKRGNLLCQNKTLSFRKAQVYDQLMSMIDSVQDLQEKWHDEDACRLLALITDLKVRCEKLLLLPEDQISAADWLRLQVECNTLIRDAKKNIAHFEIPEKWCSLELTYLELKAHKKKCQQSKDVVSRKKAKVYSHLLELLDKADSMKRSAYRDDAKGAVELALQLIETSKPYLTSSSPHIDWKKLEKECKAIVSEAEYKLAYYGFLQLILTNFLLAVTGLCLLKAAFTGSFFIHNSSEECVQEIQETASLVSAFGSAAA